MLDLDTGERRTAAKKDLEESTRLADALENIDFLMGLIIPQDVHQKVARARLDKIVRDSEGRVA